MGQIVTLNGRPLDLDYEPSVVLGSNPLRRTPIEINGKVVYGVNINGYDYPPASPNSVAYFPGLPGQGTKLWDRSKTASDGTITGAAWKRLPSGLFYLDYDGSDDVTTCGVALAAAIQRTAFTVRAWIKPDTGGDIGFGRVCQIAPAIFEMFMNGGQNIHFRALVGGVTKSATSAAGSVPFGSWTRIIGVFTTSNVFVFTNKTKVTGAATGAQIEDPTGGAFYMGDEGDGLRNFDGGLAPIEVINGAWTDDKIYSSFEEERVLFGV